MRDSFEIKEDDVFSLTCDDGYLLISRKIDAILLWLEVQLSLYSIAKLHKPANIEKIEGKALAYCKQHTTHVGGYYIPYYNMEKSG